MRNTRPTKNSFTARLLAQYKPGDVFSSFDFRRSGVSLSTVRSTFSRLTRKGVILRLSGGYYAVPRISRVSGRPLYPDSLAVAKAVARRSRSKFMPSGAILANKYLLSEQVPARDEFLVRSGPREIRMGTAVVRFLRAEKGELAMADTLQGELTLALSYVGSMAQDGQRVRSCLSQALNADGKSKLNAWAPSAPEWIRPLISNLL